MSIDYRESAPTRSFTPVAQAVVLASSQPERFPRTCLDQRDVLLALVSSGGTLADAVGVVPVRPGFADLHEVAAHQREEATALLYGGIIEAIDNLGLTPSVVGSRARTKSLKRIGQKAVVAVKGREQPGPMHDIHGVCLVVANGVSPQVVLGKLQTNLGLPERLPDGTHTLQAIGCGNSSDSYKHAYHKLVLPFVDGYDELRLGELQVYDEAGWRVYCETRPEYEQRRHSEAADVLQSLGLTAMNAVALLDS